MTNSQAANFVVCIRRRELDKIVTTKCMLKGRPSAELFKKYMLANHIELLRIVNNSRYANGNYHELFKLLNK